MDTGFDEQTNGEATDLDTGTVDETTDGWWKTRGARKTKVDWSATMEIKCGQDRPRTAREAKECDRLDEECPRRTQLAGGMRWFGKNSASENESRSLDSLACFTYLPAEEEDRIRGEGYS